MEGIISFLRIKFLNFAQVEVVVVASSGIGVFAMGELVQVQEDGERKDDDDENDTGIPAEPGDDNNHDDDALHNNYRDYRNYYHYCSFI